jgi:KDO2-lipid IV(A) lauroyltransferase
MLAARKRMGADMVKPNLAGVKSMLAKLKDGGVVLIASDQVPKPEGGLLSNFFSEPALTMTLVSKLKLKTEAPCHSVYCLRKPKGGGFKVMFSKEIKGMDLDMQSSVDCMNQELEKCIMNAPEQYAWEYKRYKHSGIKDLY